MSTTNDKYAWSVNGFIGLILALGFFVIAAFMFGSARAPLDLIAGALSITIAVLILSGFTALSPNEARVLTFLGSYLGTVKTAGFHWTLPLTSKRLVTLRVQNFNSGIIKVNDAHGNPIEIAAIISWRVIDPARASFDVQSVSQFVSLQAEGALRAMASRFPYDAHEEHDSGAMSLRANPDEVAEVLKRDVQDRLGVAGVEVVEARVAHLAYAQEIASVMLRRQQAEAILAARRKIVEGAVSMVEMALTRLEKDVALRLDEAQRAHMINNLLVAIISEREASPVINVGT